MKFDHNNISPLDNRYLSKIQDIRSIFSEYNLLKTRFLIEINWLLYLCQKYPNYFSKLSNQSKNKIVKFRDSFDDKSEGICCFPWLNVTLAYHCPPRIH